MSEIEYETDLKELKITIKLIGKYLVEDVACAEEYAIYAVREAAKCYRWGIRTKVDEEMGDIRVYTRDTPKGYVCEVTLMSELEQEFYNLKKEGKIDERLGIDELVEKLIKAGDTKQF